MNGVLPLIAVLAGFAAVLGGLWSLAVRARRRGVGTGGLLGPIDEVFHPAAEQSRAVVQAQYERTAPSPAPGDKPPPDP